MILKTKRLYMREMRQSDFPALSMILQDNEVMYAYNGAFDDIETQNWLEKQLSRYEEYHHRYGLWAVILTETDEMIGQCGITMQPIQDRQVPEIGYLFQKKYWHKGYAIEAAKACREYAFAELRFNEVFSIIRDTNLASQKVAERNGMTAIGALTKHYRGVDMPHIIYSVKQK